MEYQEVLTEIEAELSAYAEGLTYDEEAFNKIAYIVLTKLNALPPAPPEVCHVL